MVPGVTSVNKKGGPMAQRLLDWYIREGKKSKKKSADAASIGKLVHKYAEFKTEGKEFDWNEVEDHKDSEKIKRCIRLYENWYKDNEDKVLGTELLIGSPKLLFGGMIDRLVYSRKWGKVIDDYKTSSGFFIDNFIQAAGYSIAAREWLNEHIDTYRILLFPKTGTEFHTLLVTGDSWLLDGKKVDGNGVTQDDLKQQFLRNRSSLEFHKRGDKFFDNIYEDLKNE